MLHKVGHILCEIPRSAHALCAADVQQLDLHRKLCLGLQVDACEAAAAAQSEVQHPMLEKVRQCSTHPDEAAHFFQKILSPVAHVRVEAMHESWCANTVSRMFAETGTSYDAEADRQRRRKQRRTAGLRAALFGCFGCAGSCMAQDSCCSLPAGRPDTASTTFLGMNRHVEAAASSSRCRARSRATITADAQRTAALPPKLGFFSRTKSAVKRKLRRCSPDATQQMASASAVGLSKSDVPRLQRLDQLSAPSRAASSGKDCVIAISITAVSGLQLDY